MAVNKNFAVRHGLEVNTNLILADANTNKVGIASTAPRTELDVRGGIAATDLNVTGVGTFANELNVGTDGSVLTVLGIGGSVGIRTTNPEYLLDIRSPVSTGQTALYVQGDVEISGDLIVDDISFDQADINSLNVTGIATINELGITGFATISYLEVTGVSTFTENVDINSFVDISDNLNVVGLTTLGSYVDINDSVDISSTLNVGGISTFGSYVDINDSVDVSGDLNVVGLTTLGSYVDINDSVDVSGDLNVVGLTTIGGDVTAESNLYVDGSIGIGTTNATSELHVVGDINLDDGGTYTTTLQMVTPTADRTISFPDKTGTVALVAGSSGQVTYNSAGVNEGSNGFTYDSTSGLSLDNQLTVTGNINISGISTLGTVQISSGIVTASSGIVTYYGDGQYLENVIFYTGIGINSEGVSVGTGVTIIDFRGTGISTVTVDSGIGTIFVEGLTGAGSTVFNDTTTNQEFYLTFTDTTSGIITSTGISTSKLTYNPFSGEVTAVDYNSTSDQSLKTNIQTIDNALDIVSDLRGVSFDWKETGKPSYGVIAQELEQVLPELVGNGDIKTVNYNGIIGVLIEAIKELKSEIEELKFNK